MASTYSTDLKLELMVTGENAGTWGDKTNSNLNLLQQSIAGVQAIDVGAADVTLVMSNATLSNARNMVLVLNGSLTGNRQVLVPNGIEKFYVIHDQTTRNGFSLTVKTVSGTGFAIETTSGASDMVACYSDGTDVYEISLNTLSGSIAAAQIDSFAVTSAKLNSFAVTSAKVASYAITSAKLATNAVTAIKITQSTITQSKLATGSVGADQLIATAVTPGTYTAATVTVDADGRITSASSGSGGAGGFVPVLFAGGPTSGTYTKNTAANRIGVYMFGGGGGVPGNTQGNPTGPIGGDGGGGFYNYPTTTPFSQPYSVGAGGNGTPYVGAQTANAGGSTNLTNVGTVNGGAGASNNATGATGNQPGASLTCPIAFPERQGYFISTSQGNQQPVYAWGGGTQIRYEIPGPYYNGSSGAPGLLIVYENTGT
jgi:hypothetical protein